MERSSPIIIIGAARSGTNMLRDVLSQIPGVTTWPCDEINAIWKHGNRHVNHDELDPSLARPDVISFIRRKFKQQLMRSNGETVVEKTCANSLRVPFVNEVFPEARYVLIVRDGLDAAVSAMKRWRGGVNLSYTVRKARFVPLGDLPGHAVAWLGNRLKQVRSEDDVLSTWGPRPRGIDQFLRWHGLAATCAMQWSVSVTLADRALSEVPAGRRIFVNYEDFVQQPLHHISEITTRFGISVKHAIMQDAVQSVSTSSIGRGRRTAPAGLLNEMRPYLLETLRSFGYEE